MSAGGVVENVGAVSASASQQPSAKPTILVIDDSPIAARAMARTLTSAGYDAAVFHTGSEALNYVRNRQAESGDGAPSTPPAAAALVDIHLPDIHGLVVSAKLREALGPAAPIIVISGDTSMANLNALSHVGATYFFSKPVSPATLLERLRESLQHE
jgi:CheY-like chemotaxis protein